MENFKIDEVRFFLHTKLNPTPAKLTKIGTTTRSLHVCILLLTKNEHKLISQPQRLDRRSVDFHINFT